MIRKFQQIIIILSLSFLLISSPVYANNMNETQAIEEEDEFSGEDQFNGISSDSADETQSWMMNDIWGMWETLKSGVTSEMLWRPLTTMKDNLVTVRTRLGLPVPVNLPSPPPVSVYEPGPTPSPSPANPMPGAEPTPLPSLPLVSVYEPMPGPTPSPSLPKPGVKPTRGPEPTPPPSLPKSGEKPTRGLEPMPTPSSPNPGGDPAPTSFPSSPGLGPEPTFPPTMPPVSVVSSGEVRKFSNKEFENIYIKPSLSRSRSSLRNIEFTRNTNLKLHSLFLSNSALGQ